MGIWEVNLGYFWGVWGRKGWGLKGAGLGCLGSEEGVWGPREAGLGCLGSRGLIWVEGIEFGVAQGPGFGVFGGFGGGNMGDLGRCGV